MEPARGADAEELRSESNAHAAETGNAAPSAQSRRPRLSMGVRAKQIGNVSAFRSTTSSSGGNQSSSNGEGGYQRDGRSHRSQETGYQVDGRCFSEEGPGYHGRDSSQAETSDSTDAEMREERKRRFRKKPQDLEKAKSSSMQELAQESRDSENGRFVKSLSQEDILESGEYLDREQQQHSETAYFQRSSQVPGRHERSGEPATRKHKIIYVRSSDSENDSFDSITNGTQSDDQILGTQPIREQNNNRIKAQSSQHLYKYDSDSDRALPEGLVMQRHNAGGRHMVRSVSRDENMTSQPGAGSRGHVKRQAPLPTSVSESYINTVSILNVGAARALSGFTH